LIFNNAPISAIPGTHGGLGEVQLFEEQLGPPIQGVQQVPAADILEHIRQSREEATNGTPVEGYVEMAPRTDDGRADDGFIPLARGISNPRALNINRATAVHDFKAQTKALLARRNANALDDNTSDSDSGTSECPPLVDPAEFEGTSESSA